MKEKAARAALIVCGVLTIPFLLMFILARSNILTFSKEADTDAYLPLLLMQTLPDDCESETAKAQAVLLRTTLLRGQQTARTDGQQSRVASEAENSALLFSRSIPHLPEQAASDAESSASGRFTAFAERDQLRTVLASLKTRRKNKAFYNRYQAMQAAAESTKSLVLCCEGALACTPFCRSCNGKTRDGSAIASDSPISCLSGVDSPWDLQDDSFMCEYRFTADGLCRLLNVVYPHAALEPGSVADAITIAERDPADYALTVQLGGQLIAAEDLRITLGLSSACFTITRDGADVRFLCRGRGHGLGMSQCGADALARRGKHFTEILSWYFPKAVLTKWTE